MITWLSIFAIIGACLIITVSLVYGVELPLYVGIALLGIGLYVYKEDPLLNLIGGYIARAGIVLLIVATVYYLFSGKPVFDKPFEFKFLRAFITIFIGFWQRVAEFIGGIVFKLLGR